MRIHEASNTDLDDVLSVERSAFGQEDEAELVQDLLKDPSALPLLSLLARQGQQAVGHILFTAARLQGATREVSIVILAPLAVLPEAQGTGIGGALIERGSEILREAGVELIFLVGHPSYYPRHGFEAASPHDLVAPYVITPDEAWMVRALRAGVVDHVRGTVACAAAMDKPEYWRE